MRNSYRTLGLVLLLAALLSPAGTAGAASGDFRAKAVSWALDHIGHREVGTSNCSKQITRWERDMGLNAPPCRPWCGAFVHQAFLQAGVRLSARLIDPDRSYGDAVAGVRHLRRIDPEDVRRGDLLFFAFRKGLRASHIAIARDRPWGGRVATAEGNVSNESVRESRALRYVVLAARVVP
jgi:cell wall-associated NlpC family hydrolase